MENYILKLVSGTTYRYKLYSGTTLVSDTDLAALFATAGSAYFSFDFDGGTSYEPHVVEIINSSNTRVVYNNELTATVSESKNYKATWSANATAFDTFEELPGKTLDESQLGFLMGKIKTGGGGGPTVVQTIGTSNADVMSQWATSAMVYNGGDSRKVNIGVNSAAVSNWDIAIFGTASQEHSIAIGHNSDVTARGAIALGVGSRASTQGVFDVGLSGASSTVQSNNGYNGSAYRLLSGLYDPQSAHDAATKNYVDNAVAGAGGGGITEIQLTATTVIRDLITGGTIDKTGRYLLVNDTANNITLHANASNETLDLARIDAGRQAILDVVLYENNNTYIGYYYAVLNYRDNNGGHTIHFNNSTFPSYSSITAVDSGTLAEYIQSDNYGQAPSAAAVYAHVASATANSPQAVYASSVHSVTSTGFSVDTGYDFQSFLPTLQSKEVYVMAYIESYQAPVHGLPAGYYKFRVNGYSDNNDIYLTYVHSDGTIFGGVCPGNSQHFNFTVTKH